MFQQLKVIIFDI